MMRLLSSSVAAKWVVVFVAFLLAASATTEGEKKPRRETMAQRAGKRFFPHSFMRVAQNDFFCARIVNFLL